jgi:hypothetical protein
MADPKPAKDKSKTDPAATREDDPRPAPEWKHPDPAADKDEDDELFNDMPV